MLADQHRIEPGRTIARDRPPPPRPSPVVTRLRVEPFPGWFFVPAKPDADAASSAMWWSNSADIIRFKQRFLQSAQQPVLMQHRHRILPRQQLINQFITDLHGNPLPLPRVIYDPSHKNSIGSEAWLDRLIAAELADRQARSLRYQLKAARFPMHRDHHLHRVGPKRPCRKPRSSSSPPAAFMDTAHNLILVGGTGTGKTHFATALGVAAIHAGKRVRFFNAVDLVNQLEREKQQGKAGQLARQLVQAHAVILDELGYLPFPASGGALLFHLISQLYEKTSLIITTPISPSPNGGSMCSAMQK